jgi:hypothetical protein
MNEKQLAKLIKKNGAKAEQNLAKKNTVRAFDPTLAKRDVEDKDVEREQMFKDMKRREF